MKYKLFASLSIAAAMSTVGLAQVSNFDSLNGYVSGVDVRLAQARTEMLRASRAESESNLLVAGSYVDRKVDASLDSIERSSHGESGRVGYNWKVDTWSFGAALGYGTVRSDYNEINSPSPTPLHGYVDSDTTEGYVWAVYNASGWRVALEGSLGTTKNKARRTSDAGSSTAHYNSSDHAFGLSLSREFSISDGALLEPFVGLSFASASVDGFTEQGTAPDRRIVKDFSMDRNRGAAGVRIVGKSPTWRPYASVGWLTRFSGDSSDISSTAINGMNAGVGRVQAASKGLFYASTGISGKIDENWSSAGTIEYFTGGDERAVGLSLSIGRKF